MAGIKNFFYINTLVLTFIVSIPAFSMEWASIRDGAKPSVPNVKIVEESGDYLLIEWRLDGFYTENVETGGGNFDRILFDKNRPFLDGKPGEPALPVLAELIQIPKGKKASVKLISAEWRYAGDYRLMPKQPPTRDDGSRPPEFKYNPNAYDRKIPFPSEFTYAGSPQGWGGIAVSGVYAVPVKYYPVAGRLEIAEEIRIRVDFIPGDQNIVTPRVHSKKMESLHRTALVNYSEQAPVPFDAAEIDPVRMLFVMKEEALEIAQPLIDFHNNTGLRTDVFLADDLEEPEELKDVVREYYEDGLEYLMLIGDSYRFSWDVPMFYWDPEDPGLHVPDTDTHSDTWYTCLDEPDEDGYDDHIPDLAVGRLTYEDPENIDELELQIDKIMDYLTWSFEEQDDDEWLSRSVMVASSAEQDGVPVYLNCKEGVVEYDYSLQTPDLIPYFGNDRDASVDGVIDEVNDPGIGFFNYRGHGSETAMHRCLRNRSITGNTVEEFENRQRPFILVSSACLNGNIATRRSDCLLEEFQKHNGGSVSAHGSVISTFTDGNSFHDQRIFQAFFDEGVYDLGYANNLAMTEMVMHFDRPGNPYKCIGRMNLRAYIWLGDPALEYRLRRPLDVEVAIPDTIVIGTEWIEAEASMDGEPLEQARVTVRTDDNEIYFTGVTDERGIARINFDPLVEQAIDLDWTIYHRNAMVTGGEIIVADAFGVIMGEVAEFGSEEPVQNAILQLTPFNLMAESDENGGYIFSNIPERNDYRIEVQAEGFDLEVAEGINVAENDTTVVNFELRYGLLTVDRDSIRQELELDNVVVEELLLSNTGNGAIEWSGSFMRREPYDLVNSVELSHVLDDTRLSGVAVANERLYIAGGNNNQDPNYIYILDTEGAYLDRFEQPEGSAGVGIHDLAYDGEFLYGSAFETIFKMELDGVLAAEIDGPFNPNTALAADGDGCLWVCNNRTDIVKIDLEGNVVKTIPNEYAVRGLAWLPESDDGYSLQVLARNNENEPVLYEVNPETEMIRFAANLQVEDNDFPGDGLFITDAFQPFNWNLLGLINNGAERFLRTWFISEYYDWISFAPAQGRLDAAGESRIEFTFDSRELRSGGILNTVFNIVNTGREPLIEIPVQVNIEDPNEIDENQAKRTVLSEFEIGEIYPNPFNSVANLNFAISSQRKVTVNLHDVAGRRIFTLVNEVFPKGKHSLVIDGDELSSGIYLISIESENFHQLRKIAFMR